MIRISVFSAAMALGCLPFAAFAEQTAEQVSTAEAVRADQAVAGELVNNTAFGNWVVNCEAITVKRSSCHLTQELTLRDSGDLVVRLMAMPANGGAVLLAQTPIGVYLPGGAVWRIAGSEEAQQHSMIWQRCFGQICEAAQALRDSDLETMAGAEKILFGYRMDASVDPVVIELDVARLQEGVSRLREEMVQEELGTIPPANDP